MFLIYVLHDQLPEFSPFLLSAYNLSQPRISDQNDFSHAAHPQFG